MYSAENPVEHGEVGVGMVVRNSVDGIRRIVQARSRPTIADGSGRGRVHGKEVIKVYVLQVRETALGQALAVLGLPDFLRLNRHLIHQGDDRQAGYGQYDHRHHRFH
jgi:hypothetical protein